MLFTVPNIDQLASGKDRPTLFLCAGKDCFKKQRPAFNDLRSSAIDAGLDLCMVKCQGSCKGPTAVVQTSEGPRWFEALDTKRLRTDLVSFAVDPSEPSKKLTKRELQGKKKNKAAKKLASQLG
jgi:hypothetical protein